MHSGTALVVLAHIYCCNCIVHDSLVQVYDIDSMIKLMRYNNYTMDPLSKCDCNPPYSGENAISARNDLNPRNGTYPFHALSHR